METSNCHTVKLVNLSYVSTTTENLYYSGATIYIPIHVDVSEMLIAFYYYYTQCMYWQTLSLPYCKIMYASVALLQ